MAQRGEKNRRKELLGRKTDDILVNRIKNWMMLGMNLSKEDISLYRKWRQNMLGEIGIKYILILTEEDIRLGMLSS
jgi:hypothetical protein